MRRRAVIVIAFVLAIVLAAPTMDFPFGRDQGLYHYVGREWLHGALPYRDVFEQKTPGIFMVHAIASALFGDAMWSIRIFDFLAVLFCGVCAALAATPKSRRFAIETCAIATLVAAILYFGSFDYWNTAQCEIWVAASILAALAVAQRVQREKMAACSSGLLCGVALVFKPPAMWLVFVCAARARHRLAFLASAAVPWVLVLSYFAMKGGSHDLFDVLVGANGHYVRNERATDDTPEFLWRALDAGRIGNPLSTILAFATIASWWRARRSADHERQTILQTAIGLAVAVVLAVAMQGKFYRYHLGLLIAPASLAAAAIAERLTAYGRARGWPAWRSPAILVANATFLFFLSYDSEFIWIRAAKQVVLHRLHRTSDEAFHSFFRIDVLAFNYRDDVAVADWLTAHASPGDRVAVRGFEPQIYALTGMSYGGRFFWTTFLTMPTRAYRRDEWLARDREDLVRIRPRFVVSVKSAASGADSASYFSELGYAPRADIGAFEVLERP